MASQFPWIFIFIDPLAEISKEGEFLNLYKEPFKDVYAAVEVYKASQIMYQEELDFGNQNLRSVEFLERKISNVSISSDQLISKTK